VHVAIAACLNYNLLLRDDGMLISWGGFDWLEPGIPRYHYRQPDGTEFVTIAAGWNHILALTSDGAILAWGWPTGDYPFDYFSRPVPEGIVFTDAIAAGYKFSLGLKTP
jgi:alpha-tubulin suppressor-like RCC1 family protein